MLIIKGWNCYIIRIFLLRAIFAELLLYVGYCYILRKQLLHFKESKLLYFSNFYSTIIENREVSFLESRQNYEVQNIVRHNYLVSAHFKLNCVEMRIVYYAIARAYKKKKIEPIDISAKDLAQICNIRNKNYAAEFDRVTNGLMSKFLVIKDLKTGEWHKRNWTSGSDYVNGRMTIKLNKDLEPYITDLHKEFVSTNFDSLMSLSSQYSMRIYEMCKQYERIGHRRIEVQEFRQCLGIDDSKAYDRFSNIKARVIAPAVAEINATSPMHIDVEYIKQGRSVKEIDFIISSKDSQKAMLDEKVTMKNIVGVMKAMFPDEWQEYFVNGATYALRNLDYTMHHNPDNIAAYFKTAFEQNYACAPMIKHDENCKYCKGLGVERMYADMGNGQMEEVACQECHCRAKEKDVA